MNRFVPLAVTGLRGLHLACVLFVIFGWLSPFPWLLKVHAIFIPLLFLHWQTNGGTCVLTNIEYRLKGARPGKEAQQGSFIKSLFASFGFKPALGTLKVIFHGLLLSSWLLGLSRIFL